MIENLSAKYSDAALAMMASYGMSFLGAVLTLVLGFAVAGWLERATTRAVKKADKLDPIFHRLPGKVVRVVVIVITLIAVLNRFGVETTSLIAMLGAAGLAIGLALQGTLSNVAAGVMILVFRPFNIGDVVDLGGKTYVIDALGFFVCKAHLLDGPTAFLPNSKIWGETIVNMTVTENDQRRFDQVYGIGYDDDINQAILVLKAVLAADERVLKSPAPLVEVQSLGDNSVNILLRVWTARTDWLATQMQLMRQIKQALDTAGISIPYPQRDVHVIAAAAPDAAATAAPALRS